MKRHRIRTKPYEVPFLVYDLYYHFYRSKVNTIYFTASFSAFAALNLGTRVAATLTCSPVLGLRAMRAARALTEKIPSPAIETSSPFLRVLVMLSIMLSTTSSACTLVPPTIPCTRSTSACLFIEERGGDPHTLIISLSTRFSQGP